MSFVISARLVIDPAPASVSEGKRRRSDDEEMMNATKAEKLKLVKDLVGIIIGEPISDAEPPVADTEMTVSEEEPQKEAEAEKLPADINAPSDVDFSHLHLLAETSAIAEQFLNASHTTENLK